MCALTMRGETSRNSACRKQCQFHLASKLETRRSRGRHCDHFTATPYQQTGVGEGKCSKRFPLHEHSEQHFNLSYHQLNPIRDLGHFRTEEKCSTKRHTVNVTKDSSGNPPPTSPPPVNKERCCTETPTGQEQHVG